MTRPRRISLRLGDIRSRAQTRYFSAEWLRLAHMCAVEEEAGPEPEAPLRGRSSMRGPQIADS
jgi:hypothetical protein